MMTMTRFLPLNTIALILLLIVGTASADSRSIELTSTALSPFVSEKIGGGSMVFQIEIPDVIIGTRLDAVLLEFRPETFVDPGAVSYNVPISVAPCVSTQNGREIRYDRAVTRIIAVGTEKRVVLDLTNMVKEWMAAGTMSHQVAIGSMITRDATLSLNAIAPGDIVAKLTFLYQHRFGQRAPRD
jgi:hypothetical protein